MQSEKFHGLIIHKTSKTLFWAYYFAPKTFRTRLFSKNRAASLFELDGTQNSYKKSENSYKLSRRKTADKQTNE